MRTCDPTGGNWVDKLFHHGEHEGHEVILFNQSPLRALRVLRGEDTGLRAPPALEGRELLILDRFQIGSRT